MAKKRRKRSSSSKRTSQSQHNTPTSQPVQNSASTQRIPGGLTGVIAIAVVAVLAGALFWASQRDSQTAQEPAPAAQPAADTTAPETMASEENPGEDSAEEPHALPPTGSLPGFAAPEFSLTSLDEQQIALSDFKGKPVFVSFFHTW